jgi:lipoprotein NlpD
VVRWSWPTRGRIIRRFSVKRGNKGIDIGGKRGQAVRAAAGGKVVYRGSGLRGYGQLIIVKHNETFLSAYAHNEKILVKEGEVVRSGQRIATLGNTGAKRHMLHFEIRRHGLPVNPVRYLPRNR